MWPTVSTPPMSGKPLLYVSETGSGGYAQAAQEYLLALKASEGR